MRCGTYLWIVFLSALVFVAVAGAESEDYVVTLNRTYGGPDAGEAVYAIVADPEDGFFLAGETGSFGAGKTDAWLVRLTADGSEEWNRTYGGEEADTARSVLLTENGTLLLAGNLTYVTNGTRLDTDAWLLMVDPSGDEVWNRTYGGADVNASANAVTPTGDGGFLFVGSTAAWGGNESDAWAVRVNETGGEVWSRVLGGSGNDTANAVVRLPDGDFVFAGSTESSGAGMADVWVVRLNESGGEVWNRTFGSPDDDLGRAVINTPDGGLLVAGTFTERPDNETIDTDALLIKLTPAGDIIWNWIYGDFGVNESATAVIWAADGGYVFAGETGFLGVDDTDAWIVGTDAAGAVVWSKIAGGVNPGDRAASLVEAEPGGYVVAGTFNATVRDGSVNTDAWVIGLEKAPEPTPTPTTTPTPAPTVAPLKPPKAPVVPQKTPVTAAPTPVPTTPTPIPTRVIKPVGEVTIPPAPTLTVDPTPRVTVGPTPRVTVGPTPRVTVGPTPRVTVGPTPRVTVGPTPRVTVGPTPAPRDDDDDDDDERDDDDGERRALSGTVWYDLDGDGAPGPGEPGIPGISVRLIGMRTMFDAAVTGPDGSYRFEAVPTGGYSGAEFLLPDGYSCTISGPGNDAVLLDGLAFAGSVDGQETLNAGFIGDYQTETPETAYGWVLGTTWSDDNQDGIRDETYGMTDVEVRLMDAEGEVLASARTGYHDRYTSFYLFGPLLPGEYAVAFTPPEGYVFTAPGGNSSPDPSTGSTDLFVVGGGDIVTRDAGLIIPAPTPTPPAGEAGGAGDVASPENESIGDGGDARDPPPPSPDWDLPTLA